MKLSSANANAPTRYLNGGENMGFSVPPLRLRVLMMVIIMFFMWQALKLIPVFLAIQDADGDTVQRARVKSSPVLVTVFYEALCPDSKSFITRQLLPSYEKAPKLMAISFIPYGKAKTVEDRYGNLSFSCQHGPVECQANKIHACAVNHIRDTGLLLKYIACMISDNLNPKYIAEECGRQLAIDVEPIIECSTSRKGSEYLQEYGERTMDLAPPISFVPTILLNHQRRKQTAILKNLFGEICATYEKPPPECFKDRTPTQY